MARVFPTVVNHITAKRAIPTESWSLMQDKLSRSPARGLRRDRAADRP